ncbi:MAG: hypothetical protein L0332_15515 [Chloroflexi bacterium]|nr:hypothetical protein [Chloroflexota bacterium]MCI0648937.1 hypothetical protein [Chloroflexota bacterium]MCI0728111.1 hypothetical protein [Chloroflexota bacterium]
MSAGVKVYASLGQAVLQAGLAEPYQVWLLCRRLDRPGRGWVAVEAVREQLTNEEAPLRLFSQAHLQQVLEQGEGLFWTWHQDPGRLWLRGVGKVAAALGVNRFRERPVRQPVGVAAASSG